MQVNLSERLVLSLIGKTFANGLLQVVGKTVITNNVRTSVTEDTYIV